MKPLVRTCTLRFVRRDHVHRRFPGPVLLVAQSLGHPPRASTAVAMMLGSFATVLIWKYGLGFDSGLYHALPRMLIGVAIYFIGNAVVGEPAE
jgi:hypothetical protein